MAKKEKKRREDRSELRDLRAGNLQAVPESKELPKKGGGDETVIEVCQRGTGAK